MVTITTHADLAREPQCPLCRHVLIGPTTVYLFGIAFCDYCSRAVDTAKLTRLYRWHADPIASKHWSTDKGLLFFTPDRFFPERLAADLGHIFLTPSHRRPPDCHVHPPRDDNDMPPPDPTPNVDRHTTDTPPHDVSTS